MFLKVGTLDDSFTFNVDLVTIILGATWVKPDELIQGRDISDLYLPKEKIEFHDAASLETELWREEFFYEFYISWKPMIHTIKYSFGEKRLEVY